MPIHDTGYRAWEGNRVSRLTRWTTICSTGVRRAYQSKWLRRLLAVSTIPLLFFAIPFMLFEQSTRDQESFLWVMQFVQRMPQSQMLQDRMGSVSYIPDAQELSVIRRDIWSFLFLSLLRLPQLVLMVILVGIVAPPLISQDLRTRAYLIYFSRPISRFEYIIGKFGVVSFFLAIISVLPPLLLYAMGILLSPNTGEIFETWDLPVRIVIAAVTLIVPTTLVALAISSLTLESRYASFAWFSLWIAGHITYSVLYASMSFSNQSLQHLQDPGMRFLVSPYQILGVVQAYIFGFDVGFAKLAASVIALVVASGVSTAVLFNRVQAPMRA